ncbi:TadA family conjugal transfer-associated ATPase [Corynebacterium coyleae]|uniref:TadA family conjugal transfer-associated ATPase n=1 Tax=Corynebacterium coyleae TaxID=53374 RepID=UPI00254EC6D0|nr:TadA family conjugal transfer-associated ATPase [Corynebacterium coyleae]MDK8663890.1 TadA family conjugal transfer-associated ATPase [Corynebacterium coyleae]MDK8706845.1 TadA family conjugal transfer-associated ATPase [Corynebacterium coyleae]MDK8733692.1 TadA family conjugal transfer-associated ATPase [Corynebacterium coyleae]MDK8892888.1 TadA family conjugal transfer-associated ATPase [Corynebacterium coyleae]
MTDRDLIARVKRRLADEPTTPEPARIAALIREEAVVISDIGVLDVMRTLRDDTTGTGPLEALLADDTVTDICVNGPNCVYVDSGAGLERSAVRFESEAAVRRLASRLAASCGRRLDDAQPFCDGHITRDDGTLLRFHAVLAPTAQAGTCISLRVLHTASATLDDLVARGALGGEVAEVLRGVVAKRKAFVVVGGTGSGKTTLLSALLAEVDPAERIVAIEDTLELTPDHPHVVNLTTRGANSEGAGEITIADLVRQSLRMRPDRVVVGEIRGAEVVDLLAALNTGHDGGAGTLHANSIAEVPARFEALAALGGLDRAGLHAQLAAAIDVVIVVKRHPDGTRRLSQIGVLEGQPVRAKVVWDADAGPAEGYEELLS